eukprot:CAMPEP_0196781756 /NCGR_PEP_ID=MMETSP1104-20130614/10305_1 /TAXON_ID=33652 /ORGANISM="Cafeteria sp., Strain Caron Lab Isolate" /LENGTH=182 /DNA_ID=CAMNT_0042151985 /DNA_START=21 /DNA_END=569 /DNA_ORIENTATION=+
MEGVLQEALEKKMVETLEVVEGEVDKKLSQLETMGDDELDRIRERRKAELKRQALKRQEWRMKGHGRYTEVTDEKSFFAEAKQSERVVAHFYRPSTWRCEIVDKHLSELCVKHVETKFIKVNVEKTPFLVERLNIWMLPTMVLIKGGKTDHSIVGFDEMGGSDEFPTEALEARLVELGIIFE